MRAVIQRVSSAGVRVDGHAVAAIRRGLLLLAGFRPDDTARDIEYVAGKVVGLRIFPDKEGKMNLSVLQTEGEVLLVPNFTLYADTRKGRRPSFTGAADPATAYKLLESLRDALRSMGARVQSGVFGAHMQVALVNDGPVTIIIDSESALGG